VRGRTIRGYAIAQQSSQAAYSQTKMYEARKRLATTSPRKESQAWVTTSWPPENLEILDCQWNQVAIPYWKELAAFARDKGVKLAVEACGGQLVHSVSTMLRLIEATMQRTFVSTSGSQQAMGCWITRPSRWCDVLGRLRLPPAGRRL
jgi:hypothetical protein